MRLPARVLVVDDEPDNRDVIREILEHAGYDVVAVGDGADALAFLARDRPHLILLDLVMDEISGWEVLGTIRADARLRDVRVVIITAASAGAPSAVPCLRKPFGRRELLDVVGAHCAAPAQAQASSTSRA